jgi:hypothetical protein
VHDHIPAFQRGAIKSMVVEWAPSAPRRLSARQMQKYRAGRDRAAEFERRIAEVAEQRVAILRDAMADFAGAELQKRDDEIQYLKKARRRP